MRDAGFSKFLNCGTYQSIHREEAEDREQDLSQTSYILETIFRKTAAWKIAHEIPEGLTSFDILV